MLRFLRFSPCQITAIFLVHIVFNAGCGAKEGPVTRDEEPSSASSRDAGSKRGSRDAGKPAADDDDDDDDTAKAEPGKNDSTKAPAAEPRELVTVDECASGNAAALSAADIEKLKAGGKASSGDWLYPYEGTVFPRGLTSPLLMWRGASGKAAYLRIRSKYFAYDGCLTVTNAGQLQLPQKTWDTAGLQTLGPSTPFEIELTTLDGQTVSGPLKRKIVIAQATLKGSIFYNSYNSALGGIGGLGGLGGLPGLPAGLPGLGNGSIIRIRAGGRAEFFLRPAGCTGCHTVSANGQRLVAKDLGGFDDGFVYPLETNTASNPAALRGTPNAAFSGLSPDGKVMINTAIQRGVGPNTTGATGTPLFDIPSILSETDTGAEVANSGVPATAMMPTFSSDGTKLVFNDFAQGNGAGISLMNYDGSARKADKLRALFTGKERGYAGWPFLLPDNEAVIFTWTEASDFSGKGVGVSPILPRGPRSDLMIVDVASGKATLLARAMGFATPEDAAQDKTYLPFGAEELHQNYYPTVSPVAAGGYFWVFFDSYRHYGNLGGMHRQLWGAAVAIQHGVGEAASQFEGPYAFDPSFPAFYLPGQELETANHRAFTALDPCRADGAKCESGIDCCSGFCTDGVCGPPGDCSESDEACKTDDDCCSNGDRCIGGFCGQILL